MGLHRVDRSTGHGEVEGGGVVWVNFGVEWSTVEGKEVTKEKSKYQIAY